MTRGKQIERAVNEIVEERQTAEGRKKYGGWDFSSWFLEGVKWADKNPKSPWISVKDSFPYNCEELVDTKLGVTDMVLVITEDHTVKVDDMQLSSNHWEWVDTDLDFDGHVTHWMPIPKLEE